MSANVKKRYTESHKKKLHKTRVRHLAVTVISSIVCLVSVGAYLLSDRFRIVDISIDGILSTSREDVDSYLAEWLEQKKFGIIPVRSYWTLSRGDLAAGLASAFPTIERVDISKEFPHALKIIIKEYAGWGVLCHANAGGCFWIDRAGVAFEPAPDGFSGAIVPKITDERERSVVLLERQLSPEMMRLITFFNEKASSDTRIQSVEFTIASADDTVRIKTRAGWELLVLEKADPEYIWKNLNTALAGDVKDNISRLEYIDLRFGNKIFYKSRK